MNTLPEKFKIFVCNVFSVLFYFIPFISNSEWVMQRLKNTINVVSPSWFLSHSKSQCKLQSQAQGFPCRDRTSSLCKCCRVPGSRYSSWLSARCRCRSPELQNVPRTETVINVWEWRSCSLFPSSCNNFNDVSPLNEKGSMKSIWLWSKWSRTRLVKPSNKLGSTLLSLL